MFFPRSCTFTCVTLFLPPASEGWRRHCFQFVSSHLAWGRGFPHPRSGWWGYPIPGQVRRVPHLRSGWGEYPISGPDGGVPRSGIPPLAGQGTPHWQDGGTHPSAWLGIPPSAGWGYPLLAGWGYPPSRSQVRKGGTSN